MLKHGKVRTKHALIVSSELDLHARAVAWAIKQYGHDVTFFDSSQPSPEPNSMYQARGTKSNCSFMRKHKFGFVWYRRLFTKNTNDRVATSDRKFVCSELTRFDRDMLQLLEVSRGVRWIDLPNAQRLAENKLLQLSVAQKYGIRVPDTFVGTEPSKINAFASRHGRVAVKPFVGQVWMQNGKPRYQTNTAIIKSTDQLDEESIRVCPAIYQKVIDKISDVRVVRIGGRLYATEYIPSKSVYSGMDIRVNIAIGDIERARSIKVPPKVADAFMLLTHEFNITYCSSDFVLDRQGRWYFVDLNPSGQFLFNEDYDKNNLLLDAMARHILALDERCAMRLRLNDYLESRDYANLESDLASASGSAVLPERLVTRIA